MGRFISGVKDEMREEVRKILHGRSVRCAVAFWGKGATDLFGPDVLHAQIICNLESGATNPQEIEKLLVRFAVRQCDTLHAKVYIGDNTAIVGSANASANGLSLEGIEQRAWLEAGVLLENVTAACSWFDQLWDNKAVVREISKEDLTRAHAKWLMRQTGRPSVGSFANFDPAHNRLPLVVPTGDDWAYDDDAIRNQANLAKGAAIPKSLRDKIDDGLEPVEANDFQILHKRWILWWQPTRSGVPDRRVGPAWVYLGDTLLRGVWHYKTEDRRRDVVIKGENVFQEPFNLHDPKFLSCFINLMSSDRFKMLRECVAPWSACEAKATEFWGELHSIYTSAAG